MATDLGTLVYTLTLNDAGFEEKLAANSAQMKGMAATTEESSVASGASFNKLGLAAAAVAIGIGYVADKTIKAAINFQSLTTQLVTGAGESASNLNLVRQGILNVSDATGEGADAAAQGMFLIESAGYHGKAGLDVLRIAAEGARIGGADFQTTANALTTVMHDYGISADNSGQAMNFLVSTVANGKMHMDDLVSSLGSILPTASQLHVPLAQVGGALSTMTVAGISSDRAANALRFTMASLAAPSAAAQKALEAVGLSSNDVADELTHQGLLPALQTITDAIGTKFPEGSAGYFDALKNITGGTRGLQGALATTGINMQTFIDNTNKIAKATENAGNKVIGWSTVQKDAKTQLDELKASVTNASIAIGEALLPAITAIARTIADVLKPLAEWVEKHKKLTATIFEVVAAAAIFITTLFAIQKAIEIVRAVMTLLGATDPIILAIMGLALVAIIVINYWSDVKQWFDDFMKWLKHTWDDMWRWLHSTTGTYVTLILAVIMPFIGIPLLIIEHWKSVKEFFETLPQSLVGIWQRIDRDAHQWWDDTVKFIKGIPKDIENALIGLAKWDISQIMDWGKALDKWWQEIDKWLKNIPSRIANDLNNWWIAVKNWIESIPGKLTTEFDKWWQAFDLWLKSIPLKITTDLDLWWQAILRWLESIPSKITLQLDKWWQSLDKWFRELPNKLMDALIQSGTDIANRHTLSFERVWKDSKKIAEIAGIVAAAIIAIPLIIAGVVAAQMIIFGIKIITWLLSGSLSAFGMVLHWFGSIGGMVINALGGAGSWLYDAGKAIILGLIRGVEDELGGAIGAIRHVGSAIIGAARSVLSWFSPSKVFIEAGKSITAGLALGISSTGHEAVKATTAMTTSVVKAGTTAPAATISNNSTTSGVTYNFKGANFNFSTPQAVDEFFKIGNRSTQLELMGGSPLAGTTRV